MKLPLVLRLALVVLACNLYVQATEDIPDDIPGFVKSLQNLYREPPSSTIKSRAVVYTDYIEQKLDNFDENETRTWQMRYMSNDEHFKAGGPMFIYVGGEWSISAGAIQGGHIYDMAAENNGILFYTEHRYYGQSKPTADITVENLKYLDVKQALADLAHFIRYQRARNPALANSKVIMVGGSYSASMVVWFKHLYPDLLTGGWASSAPLEAKVDFKEYKEVVGRAIRELGSQRCYDRIQNGIAELENMFENKRGAEVKAMLNICNNFNENNDLDIYNLFSAISNIFSGIAQYQEEGDIPETCDYLMSFDDDFSAIINFIMISFQPIRCLDMTYKGTLTYYMDSTYITGASRPWYYQTCNEYGWYQSSTSRNQPFGSKYPVEFYTSLCNDIYGDDFTMEKIMNKASGTNIHFGGKYPTIEKVFITHGNLDPWHPMGINGDLGGTMIPRASHCKDLRSISTKDSSEMRQAKERIAQLVREWLAD